jgi:hypothetical protein
MGGTAGSSGGAPAAGGAQATGGRQNPDAGAGGTGTDAGSAPVDVTLTTDNLNLGAGAQGDYCQTFRNPFGFDAAIIRSESHMPQGVIGLVARKGAGLQSPINLGSCSNGGPLVYEPQIHETAELDSVIAYPAGVGRYLPARDNIQLVIQVANTPSSPTQGPVTLKLRAVPSNQVQRFADWMLLSVLTATLQPGSRSLTRTTALPMDVELIRGLGRMYSHGTRFQAATGNQVLFDSSDWKNPSASAFAPPVHIPQGQTVTFTCDYLIPAGPLVVIPSEDPLLGERCAFTGIFYSNATTDPNSIAIINL